MSPAMVKMSIVDGKHLQEYIMKHIFSNIYGKQLIIVIVLLRIM